MLIKEWILDNSKWKLFCSTLYLYSHRSSFKIFIINYFKIFNSKQVVNLHNTNSGFLILCISWQAWRHIKCCYTGSKCLLFYGIGIAGWFYRHENPTWLRFQRNSVLSRLLYSIFLDALLLRQGNPPCC